MAISLRQLEYFVTVVDEGSFTRAAELLQVSQPGLSHQIQALDRDLGGPLLERLPRKVRLTPAGRTALPHARASLAHAQRASSAARRALGVETGELHVGTLYPSSTGILPGALRTWRRDYPELQVHLVELRHTDDLIALMEAGRAAVAVAPTPPGWDGPVREIGVEEFVIAAAPDADLPADPPQVRMADLAEHDWGASTRRRRLLSCWIPAPAVGAYRTRPVRAQPGPGRPGPGPGPWQHRPAALRRHPATPRPPGTPATVRLHPGPPRSDHRRLRHRDRGRNPCDTSPHHRPARTASQLLTSTRYAPGKRRPPRAGGTRDPGLTW